VRRLAAETKATALAQQRRYGRIAFECLRDAEMLRFATAQARRRLSGRAFASAAK
jgi:hypothetical protein